MSQCCQKKDSDRCSGCEIARLRAEVERLTGIIEQQKRTFLATMDSSATAMTKLGKVVQDQEKRLTGQPDLVDSERAANEILTNELLALRRKIGEWANDLEWLKPQREIVAEMREEAGK